jgi:hypothetical protein
MEGHRISKSWLTRRVEPEGPDWAWAVEQLSPDDREGDELWYFDELAPPGVNAGAIAVALVRDGEPIQTTITAIHGDALEFGAWIYEGRRVGSRQPPWGGLLRVS